MANFRSVLYFNAKIDTQDPQMPRAGAMLVRGNRVAALLDDASARSYSEPSLERLDLGGRTVWPGLTDSHVHFKMFADGLAQVDLTSSRNENEAIALLKSRASVGSLKEWVLGFGWSHNLWKPNTLPTRQTLDRVFPENPVACWSKCGHLLWANSKALEISQIRRDTRPPDGGEFERDKTGNLTGILKENANSLVERQIAPVSFERQRELLKRAMQIAHELGITSVHTPESIETLSFFQEIRRRGELSVRVNFLPPVALLDDLVRLKIRSGFGDDWLRLGAVKVFMDGSLGGRTAWMYEDHDSEPGNRGIVVTDETRLLEYARRANSNHLSLAIHAIGDRAVGTVLKVLAQVRGELANERNGSAPDLRNRIEHFQCFAERDLDYLRDCPIYAAMQPLHLCTDWAPADTHWGKRGRWAYAFRTLLERGARLVFGSDAPVESLNPYYGFHAALLRQDLDYQPKEGWYAQEQINIQEILRAYTSECAHASFEEDHKGRLAPGYLADFIVFDRDPSQMPPREIKNLRPVGTVLDGEWVYRAF